MQSQHLSTQVSQNDRYLAICHYIPLIAPLTVFYALLKKIRDPYSFFHLKQGFALFILWFFSVFVLALFPFVGWVIWIFLISLSIGGIYTSYHGETLKIPVIHVFGEILHLEKLYTQITGKTL